VIEGDPSSRHGQVAAPRAPADAGSEWLDQEVVVDRIAPDDLITVRTPHHRQPATAPSWGTSPPHTQDV